MSFLRHVAQTRCRTNWDVEEGSTLRLWVKYSTSYDVPKQVYEEDVHHDYSKGNHMRSSSSPGETDTAPVLARRFGRTMW